MVEVAQEHSVGYFAPRLVSMVNDVVWLELFNQPTLGIRGEDIDFDLFICKSFAVILLVLKGGR